MARSARDAVYQMLTGVDGDRAGEEMPEDGFFNQPANFFKHVASLASTKTGDGLADPKLVLSWLLATLGAPPVLIGLLVPVRESGSLLPQLAIAGSIRTLPRRKWVWAAGSLVQGLAVLGMGAAALHFEGAAAGGVILGLLAVFALARGACSVSYKDVLGKTLRMGTRGSATGTAGTVAAVLVLGFGLLLSTGILEKSVTVLAAALAVAAGLWFTAAAFFSTLDEPASATGDVEARAGATNPLSPLRGDPQLVRFILTRSLLVATALAPPYVISLAGETSGRRLGALGPFVVASALAAVSSTLVWGRLSDISSRRVLLTAAVVAAGVLGTLAALGGLAPAVLRAGWVLPALLFLLMVAYHGVRLGRSTHLVDMAQEDDRAAYTALSNTILGGVLLAGGVFGAVAQWAGTSVVLALFALMCAAAAATARGLEEVQGAGRSAEPER